jgi:hypothetical protein
MTDTAETSADVGAETSADVSAETGGRTRITAHTLERVVAAVAAEELQADRRNIDVTLTDRSGVLDLAVATVLYVVSVERAITEPRAVARSGGTVLERCAGAGDRIRDRVHELTDSRIGQITVHLTDVRVQQERRVR